MSLPWIVAAIALLAFIALIAGQKFGSTPTPAPAVADANGVSDLPVGRAPDISQLSPAERAIRLHDRVMTYRGAGQQDSVMMFAPMAIAAYEMLGELDADSRYDLGQIGEASGDQTLAGAQADTILKKNPNHLLGLLLSARVARASNRVDDERRYYQRLVAAEPAERAKKLEEYITHERDIAIALDEARRIVRR